MLELGAPGWAGLVRYRRQFIPGATFFFTVTLADRRSGCLTANIGLLREAFRRTRAELPFDIDAIVVLPEHLHVVMAMPEDDADFSHRWRRIKAIFTYGVVRSGADLPGRDLTERKLWQRRFWEHTIRDEADFARHVDYIHYNPVKHGLVQAPLDWPYSSLHRFVRQGVLAKDWGGAGDEGGGFGEPS